MDDVVGVVAAGGHATRMGIKAPKSMLTVNGKTLLEYTLLSLQKAGVKTIFVFTDRKDFVAEQRQLVMGFNSIHVIEDSGVSSTIELLYTAMSLSKKTKYLFCYGNSPRSSAIYRNMHSCEKALGAIRIIRSSRRDPIKSGNNYLEPPFFVNLNIYDFACYYSSWSELFYAYADDAFYTNYNIPPEFNTCDEWEKYSRYINTHLTGDHKPNTYEPLVRQ